MLLLIKGYILQTLGGGALLIALFMFFPEWAIKEAKEYDAEKRKGMRKTGLYSAIVGAVLIILGIIFKL